MKYICVWYKENTFIIKGVSMRGIYTSVIDIGPEGGDRGGTVIAKGTPEEVAANPISYTGTYVSKYL